MSMEQLKILAGAYALDNFTVEDLVNHTGSNPHTVRSWLRRSQDEWVEETGNSLSNTAGRPKKEWRVQPGKAEQLEITLRELWAGLGGKAGDYLAQKRDRIDFDDNSSFEIAENYIEEANAAGSDELIFEYTDMAKEWVNARIGELEQWCEGGEPVPDTVYERVQRVYRRADRLAWNIDAFEAYCSDKSVGEISDLLLDTLNDVVRFPEDRTGAGFEEIRWRAGIKREQQLQYVMTLIYGETAEKIRCALLFVLARLEPGDNYLRTLIILFIEDAGISLMVEALDRWTRRERISEEFIADFRWVLAGLEAERCLMADHAVGDWAARLQTNENFPIEIRAGLNMILSHSASGMQRGPVSRLLDHNSNELDALFSLERPDSSPRADRHANGIEMATGLPHFCRMLSDLLRESSEAATRSDADEATAKISDMQKLWSGEPSGERQLALTAM